MAGQTVRGKGSKGPRCPGEKNSQLKQCPHQAPGYGPGLAEVRSQCAQRSVPWTKGGGMVQSWQSSWAQGIEV